MRGDDEYLFTHIIFASTLAVQWNRIVRVEDVGEIILTPSKEIPETLSYLAAFDSACVESFQRAFRQVACITPK